jgi:hypothetical protein
MPLGRPSKYDPKYCQTVIDLMSEGASIEELVLELGICKQTIYNWQQEHPDFLDAIKTGVELSEGWWKREGRKALRDKDFSYTGWYMNMKNRFGWADKQQTDITTGGEKINVQIIEPDN